MKVTPFHCSPAANDSEVKAFEHLKTRIISQPGNDAWILLTNLVFSVNNQSQADEIDLVAIGPQGVQVVEIKHWTAKWINDNDLAVEKAAKLITMKARRIATTLRHETENLPFVPGAILLTQEPSQLKEISGREVNGVRLYTLNEWQEAIGLTGDVHISPQQVELLASKLQPRVGVAIDGSLRRLESYVDLELQTPKEQRFHRVYKGRHSSSRDKVVLHLYDLSAGSGKNAETKARREFEALRQLQLYSWAPRILDSFQEARSYEGEMFFFTVVDPAAPSIEERAIDESWTTLNRIAFARHTLQAAAELHGMGTKDEPFIHRNLSPDTILVKHDDSPILTGFERTKIPSDVTVASSSMLTERHSETVAPEVRTQGMGAADARSDIYALCRSLDLLFEGRDDELSQLASVALAAGLAEQPSQRASLAAIEKELSQLLGESAPPPPLPPAKFWTEDQLIRFREQDYRIVSRLGSGGMGVAFKVVQISHENGEETGTYVAKTIHDSQRGKQVLSAYQLVRSHLRNSTLSTIYEVASGWQENQFIALMEWVPGSPLADFSGVLPILAEEMQEQSGEALAIRWLRSILTGLEALHRNGLVHGDVSPRNLIVSGDDIVLTDYDCVVKVGDEVPAPGTILYSSPSYSLGRRASPSDDIYALAASFFHVLFDREPFRHAGQLEKSYGLNWEESDRAAYPILSRFLEKATQYDPQRRYSNVGEVLDYLADPTPAAVDQTHVDAPDPLAVETPKPEETIQLSEQRVEWLHSLLQSYPGSRWGNQETRGLDSEFAAHTYVKTELEKTLLRDIRERKVRLVILCGNAGDGKTALLQHIAGELGLGRKQSSERVLTGRLADGPTVRMNLDGSASWQGQSADELLDEFLGPFKGGPPSEDYVHLLAINDGRLLEWLEGAEMRLGDEYATLIDALYNLLQQADGAEASHIRFINLNQRSLVGGLLADGTTIDTAFLGRLIDQLYGGDDAPAIWAPCQTCSAKERCEVFRAARLFGPSNLPSLADDQVRQRVRDRLIEALQAVHLSGETHITMRELRAALVYIMFGVHYCDDFHSETVEGILPYWDRAFQPDSPSRQGEVLTELMRYDPALEAHPQLDRYLVSSFTADLDLDSPRQYPNILLDSARRRAYFEWTVDDVAQVAGDEDALGLTQGRHLRLFRNIPLAPEEELAEICELLCKGISRLENLPPQALDRPDVVPLQITPRTPTETAFWVEKPLSAFRLEADLPHPAEGVERLHRQAYLIYRYRDGKGEEQLRLGAELFYLLLELADGYQLGDTSTDDTFANLSIFVQRLVREDEQQLLAWNPMQDEQIYQVATAIEDRGEKAQQRLIISPLLTEERTV